jgi:ribosome-associated protein
METPHTTLDDDAAPSKSQRKREMTELQQLGEQLATLSPARLDALSLPEALRSALSEYNRIRAHEGRRRQAQYIGRLMRTVDPEPLREALREASGDSRAAIARLHALEDLRSRLLADDAALTALLDLHPQADAQQLRALLRAVRAEQAAAKPPRQYRALFQYLKQLTEGNDDGRE